MKSEKEIIDILTKRFLNVSCSNCNSYPLNSNDEKCRCATCHMKSIRWGLAEGSARIIAQQILE